MTQPLHDKLLACPFCGSERIRWCDTTPAGQHWFACDECRCEGPTHDTKEQAITAWNTRAELTRNTVADHLAEAVEALMTAADHAGGLGGCDPELEAACLVGSQALATYRERVK